MALFAFVFLSQVLSLSPVKLRGVKSIACLELLRTDPAADCSHADDRNEPALHAQGHEGQWFIGTGGYPVPDAVMGVDDPKACSSDGEYFCDPDGVLTPEQQARVREDIRFVRENTVVDCPIPGNLARTHGAPGAARKDGQLNFLLGVAVVRSLPATETDDESLQDFGMSVMDSWKLQSQDCDRSALLIVVADADKVWLAAPTCRFACGTEESGTRVIASLQSGGNNWGTRIQSGVRTFVEVVEHKMGVEKSHLLPEEPKVAAYIRRKEKAWQSLDSSLRILVISVVTTAILSLMLWFWPVLSIVPVKTVDFCVWYVTTAWRYALWAVGSLLSMVVRVLLTVWGTIVHCTISLIIGLVAFLNWVFDVIRCKG